MVSALLPYLQCRNDCRARPELGALPLEGVWRHPGGIAGANAIWQRRDWLDGRPSLKTCIAAPHAAFNRLRTILSGHR